MHRNLPSEVLAQASRPVHGGYFAVKDALDRLIAALLLLPALPVIGLLVVAIRATSRGPGMYSQPRVGKYGRVFVMYKLRSMRIDAEAHTGPTWSSTVRDPRVTRLGYWLRRLHLDELPQLFNVLRGEMSLIGPRPERPEFVKVLADQITDYAERLRIAPGITGLAQINLPPDSDLDSVRRKLILDREYLHTANVGLDIRILFCTVLRMCWIKGPIVTRCLGLERIPAIEVAICKETPAAVSLASLLSNSTFVEPNVARRSHHPEHEYQPNQEPRRAVAAGTSFKVAASPEV